MKIIGVWAPSGADSAAPRTALGAAVLFFSAVGWVVWNSVVLLSERRGMGDTRSYVIQLGGAAGFSRATEQRADRLCQLDCGDDREGKGEREEVLSE